MHSTVYKIYQIHSTTYISGTSKKLLHTVHIKNMLKFKTKRNYFYHISYHKDFKSTNKSEIFDYYKL